MQTRCTDAPEQKQQQPNMKTFILPSEVSNDPNARLVTLDDPRTGSRNRYLFAPKYGLYEFTVIAPQQPTKSILFVSSSSSSSSSEGRISKSAELRIATPVDFVFFLIPLLLGQRQDHGLFQPLDDIIDSQSEMLHDHLRYILYEESFQPICRDRVESVCDTMKAGDEKMFRFSDEKMLLELVRKAEQMTIRGLPASLEERFVRQALFTPLMAVKREDVATEDAGDDDSSPSFTTTTSSSSAAEDQSTPASSIDTDTAGEKQTAARPPNQRYNAPESIVHLLRLSTALSFIKQSYISASLCTKIDQMFASPHSPVDFAPLTAHLDHVAALRAEALASRSMADFGRKRNADEEDAKAELRAEKKRKKDEEEKKKKAGESRGVRDLKKVNISGMKKMSDFFAAPKKKA